MQDISFHALGATRARTGDDPLIPFLSGARNTPVTVSARDVQRIDAYRLQILLVAEKQWGADGVPFDLTDMAPNFREGLERLGLSPDHFDKEGRQ